MLMITGEVRKFIQSDYINKKKEKVQQSLLILEPKEGIQNYEITFSAKQLTDELIEYYSSVKGDLVTIAVSLFINYDYKFSKYNALDDGMPVIDSVTIKNIV